MITVGISIPELRKTVAKKPKSLLFARLADELRATSLGSEDKLDEALLIANKGLESNPDFLQGKLARARILLEKGDLEGAKTDFEFVTERDPFCLSAQKFLEDIAQPVKLSAPDAAPTLSQAPKEISNAQEVSVPITDTAPVVDSEEETGDLSLKPYTPKKPSAPKSKKEKEDEIEASLVSTFDSIFGMEPPPASGLKFNENDDLELKADESSSLGYIVKPEDNIAAKPNLDDILKEQLADKVEDLPDLTGDMDDLLKEAKTEDLAKEQLADKVEDLPDLTGDMDDLLKEAKAEDLAKEQLADKVEDLPDLTGDMDDLLKEAKAEDLIKEQLADKVDDLPDLTDDMADLLHEDAAIKAAKANADEPDELLTQNPTPTLAELYLNQDLPEKAVEVFKTLLAKDPENEALQDRLAGAEKEAQEKAARKAKSK